MFLSKFNPSIVNLLIQKLLGKCTVLFTVIINALNFIKHDLKYHLFKFLTNIAKQS